MLKDKIIVITGGAGLLGKEFAKAVIEHGGIVIIADVNTEKGILVKDELSVGLEHSKVDFIELDMTSLASVGKNISSINDKYGKIDALVNNAYPRNKGYGSHFFDVKYEHFCENLTMNVGGYFLTSQQFAEYFLKQGYGNIVNISSVYGIIAPKFAIYQDTQMTMPVEYAVIKSAILHLTRYMAKYLKGSNIRVNSISPGGIFDHQPAPFLAAYAANCLNKGMLDKVDIKGTLVYLLSNMSQFVNGQNIVVDDGFSI